MIKEILELTKKPITLDELSEKTGYEKEVLRDVLKKMAEDGLVEYFSNLDYACSVSSSYCASCPLKGYCKKVEKDG